MRTKGQSVSDASDDSPLVSVVIPTYNRARMVCEAVDSVLAQSHERLEVIIVDDGSSDDTVARLEQLDDHRILVQALAHSGNRAAVRNRGIAAATGSYIAFLDSDDLWLPTKLTRQLEVVSQTGHAWSYTGYRVTKSDSVIAEAIPRYRGDIYEAVITTDAPVAISSLLVCRGVFGDKEWFNEELPGYEDYDLVLRLAKREPVALVAEPLLIIREHSARTSGQASNQFSDAVVLYDRLLERESAPAARRLARRRRAYHRVRSARVNLRQGQVLPALWDVIRSLIDDPRALIRSILSP